MHRRSWESNAHSGMLKGTTCAGCGARAGCGAARTPPRPRSHPRARAQARSRTRVPVAVHMLCGVLTPQRWCSTYSCIEPSDSSSKYINRICTPITMVSLVITYHGSRILDRGSWILSGSAWICFRLAWWHFRLAWWIGEQYSRSSITVTRSPKSRQYH